MKSIICTATFVVLVGTSNARAESCVPDTIAQLSPATIQANERGVEQSNACVEILADYKKKCEHDARVVKVVAFCTDPLDLNKSATAAEIEAAKNLIESESDKCEISKEAGVTVQSGLSTLAFGSALQDDIIRGIAKFVVSRAKAEAQAYLVTKLNAKVCSNEDAKGLLPGTCEELAAADPTGGVPMAWGSLKAAFETDLEGLPERAVACVAHKKNLDEHTTAFLLTGVQIAQLVRQGEDPVAVLAGLVNRFPAAQNLCTTDTLGCGLHMLGYVIPRIAPERDGDGNAVTIKNSLLLAKIVARRTFDHAGEVGLVSKPTADQLKSLTTKLETLHIKLVQLGDMIARAKEALDKVKTETDRFQAVLRLSSSVVDLIDSARLLVPDEYFGVGKPGTDLKTRIGLELAIMKDLARAIDAGIERNYARMFVYLSTSINSFAKIDVTVKLPEELTKYGPFLAEVASAKSSDDVEHALETAAAPVGGGLAKRGEGRRTISITGFLGFQGGMEYVSAPDNTNTYSWQAGIFAPIGIDLAWGVADDVSVGAYLSVIDVGALTSLRGEETLANGDKIDTTPQIGFEQVVSPGAYFVVGYDRFAFGIGAAMTPELREISSNGMKIDDAPALRVGAFAAIDVTIFPF